MGANSKYPRIRYNDLLISRCAIWQTSDDCYALMFWVENDISIFVCEHRTFDAAENYLNKEFKPFQVSL